MTTRDNANAALHEFQEALDGLIETLTSQIPDVFNGIIPDGLSIDDCTDIQMVKRVAGDAAGEASAIAHSLR